jgi:hypothetical protein
MMVRLKADPTDDPRRMRPVSSSGVGLRPSVGGVRLSRTYSYEIVGSPARSRSNRSTHAWCD